MYDHGKNSLGRDDRRNAKRTSTAESERREGDRHLITASAEVIELSSGARFTTRTTDLGPGGCFIDTLTPFPVGAQVRVTVYRGKTHFEARGAVVYSQSGLGMGIAFDELDAAQRTSLDEWLSELTNGKHSVPESRRPNSQKLQLDIAPDRAIALRLIQLLVSKGILTDSEGNSILHDPLL